MPGGPCPPRKVEECYARGALPPRKIEECYARGALPPRKIEDPTEAQMLEAVTLGDSNLLETEVRDNNLSRSLVKHAFCMAAREGVVDKQGRRHQDLVLVDHP